MKNLGIALLLVIVATGCTNPYATMRDANRMALTKIETGMSRTQVEEIMGQRSADGGAGRFENPFKRETVKVADGKSYDVLYYYTQAMEDRPIETGLTPVVFFDRRVTGIGWGYLDGLTGYSTTTIRRR